MLFSLISLPNISKWNTNNLKQLKSLFSDCNLLLSLPDLTKWNNYDENAINSTPNYDLINFFSNDNNNFDAFEISLDELNPEEINKIVNLVPDYESLGEKLFNKLRRFYNLDI